MGGRAQYLMSASELLNGRLNESKRKERISTARL
jgi:hypothetical protein